MSIPMFVSFTIPAGASLQLDCVDGQVISITQISSNLQGKERVVVWATASIEEKKPGEKIAIASLIPGNDVVQVNFAFNSFSSTIFSLSGSNAAVTISGYSNIMYEPNVKIL